jgi:hypothetical protein
MELGDLVIERVKLLPEKLEDHLLPKMFCR